MFTVFRMLWIVLAFGCGFQPLDVFAQKKGKVLVLLSSESRLPLKNGKSYATGYYFNELIVPAMKIADRFELVVANPKGSPAVMDAKSDDISYFGGHREAYEKAKQFHADFSALKNPVTFKQVLAGRLDEYAAVFVPGGHAPMIDMVNNVELGQILEHFHSRSKPTALICHGPVALASARTLGGDWLYKNYRMAVFSTAEERVAEKALGGPVQFYPEALLKEAGGKLKPAKNFTAHVVRDRELITAQNPASVDLFAQRLSDALNEDTMAAQVPAYDPELKNYEYPFPVKFFKLRSQNQDLQMAYMDVAPAGKTKATIVLMHGKNFAGFYFEEVVKELGKKGYRVVVPDQIGFGKSSKPKNYQFSFQALADNTRQLLTALKVDKFELLGHSMGGMLATRYALMFPEQVAKLFLINPIGLEDWKTMTSYRNLDQAYQAELATSPQKIRRYQQESYYDGEWKPAYQKMIEVAIGWAKSPDYPAVAWNSAQTADMIFTQPVVYEFKNLKMPVVLVNGLRDRTAIGRAWAPDAVKSKMGDYPRLGRVVRAQIPRSVLVELPGLGHVPFVEDPAAFWNATARHWTPEKVL